MDETVAVIDFETNGLSPGMGHRATEIAAVLLRNGQVIDRFHSLMNAGEYIPPRIEALTGITNQMIRKAPSAEKVMRDVFDFVGELPLVAHNAAFDRQFWDAELGHIRCTRRQEFACSMLVARRIFPHAPSHKLGQLIAYRQLPVTGRFHRAEADAVMTAHLLVHMQDELCKRFSLDDVPHALWCRIQKTPAASLANCISLYQSERTG